MNEPRPSHARTEPAGADVIARPFDATGRIGLLGGTFDPVHRGHLDAAVLAADLLEFDEVWLVPAGRPHDKPGASTFDDRVGGLHRAVVERADPRLRICDIEEELADRMPGPVPTAATVAALRTRHPQARLTLLVGSDVAAKIDHWDRGQELLAAIPIAVIARPGHNVVVPAAVARHVVVIGPLPQLSSSMLRSRPHRHAPAGDRGRTSAAGGRLTPAGR